MSAYALTTATTVTGTALFTETGTYDSTWKDKLVTYKKYNTSTSSYQNLAITYDGAGNMLKKGSTTYTWSQGRRLSAVSNGKNIQYQYDHTGLRTKKTVDGTVTEYRLAGSLLLSEKTGSETIRYAYDSHANPVAMAIGSKAYFYVRNAQNDITGLVDATGTQVVKYSYDSWGNCTVSGSEASGAGSTDSGTDGAE